MSCLCFAYISEKAVNPTWHEEEGHDVDTKLCQVSPKKAHHPRLALKELWAKFQVFLLEACGILEIVSEAWCWDICKRSLHRFTFLCCDDSLSKFASPLSVMQSGKSDTALFPLK